MSLDSEYPLIRLWGLVRGSSQGYIARQQIKAREEHAPFTAIAENYTDSGEPIGWTTVEQINDQPALNAMIIHATNLNWTGVRDELQELYTQELP